MKWIDLCSCSLNHLYFVIFISFNYSTLIEIIFDFSTSEKRMHNANVSLALNLYGLEWIIAKKCWFLRYSSVGFPLIAHRHKQARILTDSEHFNGQWTFFNQFQFTFQQQLQTKKKKVKYENDSSLSGVNLCAKMEMMDFFPPRSISLSAIYNWEFLRNTVCQFTVMRHQF